MGGSPDEQSKILDILTSILDKLQRGEEERKKLGEKLQSDIEETKALLRYLNEKILNIESRLCAVEKKIGIKKNEE